MEKFFVDFLGEVFRPKGHFEINWPLVGRKLNTIVLRSYFGWNDVFIKSFWFLLIFSEKKSLNSQIE